MPAQAPDATSSTLVIAASAETVLDVVADLEAYPQWADDVREVAVLGCDEQGWPERVRFRIDTAVVKDTYVLAYEWLEDEAGVLEARWTLVESSVLTAMDGSYLLTPADGPDGVGSACEVTYRLAVGLRVPLPGLLRRRAEKAIVDTALRGLKRRVEGR